MGELLETWLDADLLVCATPFYFSSMSAALKTFFERAFPLFQPEVIRSGLGFYRNRTRYGERWRGKKMITLIFGAFPLSPVYTPLLDTFRYIADSIDMELGGQIVRAETSLTAYPLSKPKTLKNIHSAFVQAGREAATTGHLVPETVEAASASLSDDTERFVSYSNIYWEQATRMGRDGLDLEAVQRRVAYDVHILLREMVRMFEPRAASGLRAVLAFDFTDPSGCYQILIDRGECRLVEGSELQPDLTIQCEARVWAGIFTREIDPRIAWRDGRLELRGDKSLFSRLERLFPPAAA
jgi:putative sterol carrier protein